jgi:DNA-binding transcriptional MocR family regulator
MTIGGQAAGWEPRYARRAERMVASEIRELLKLLDQPDIVSFAGGIPDPALFPVAEIAAAYAKVLSDPALASAGLQYAPSEGYTPLRRWLVGHMASLGIACEVDNIVITCGSQQALEFLARLLLSPGDTALVTMPTYLGALQAFAAYEPSYDELRPEQGNRTPPSYRAAAAAAGGAVKFAYIVPDFANPTGETLSLAGRERLLDLASELDIPILEDTAYSALIFEGAPLPPIQALDLRRCGSIERVRTIYCGTFSKTLSPGLRIGWIVAPRALIRRLVLIKQASDLNSPSVNQMVMHHLAETVYDRQVAAARAHYRRRRDALLTALARHLPSGCSWTAPKGGLFVWLRLPAGHDSARLLQQAVAEARVAFVPGAAFYFDRSGDNTLRLSYSLAAESEIESGIARLAQLIKATAPS